MPSNAMKLSQLEAHIAQLRAEHGDLDVVLASPRDGAFIAIDGRNITVTNTALGKKLGAPAAVFGLQIDHAGRVTNMPGQRYEAEPDDGSWSYDRDAAPEGVDLQVRKRFGGFDVGRREGARWFVREGAAEWPRRPVEIYPPGILAWRPL